jgi:hypothetical protein
MSKRSARYTVSALSILALTAAMFTSSVAPAASAEPVPPAPATAVVGTTFNPQPNADRLAAAARPSRSTTARWTPTAPIRGAHVNVKVIRKAAVFPSSIRGFAACVIYRESKGTLDRRQSGSGARNGGSSAQGRWQFLNNNWQHSLPWHVRNRLMEFGMPKAEANKIRRYLDRREIATWDGWLQDIGFIDVMLDGGAHHWNPTHAGTGC